MRAEMKDTLIWALWVYLVKSFLGQRRQGPGRPGLDASVRPPILEL